MTSQQLGLLTVEQCADFLQCSVSQIERFIKAGELRRVPLSMREAGKGQRGPKGWRVTPAALQEFITLRDSYEPQPLKAPVMDTAPKILLGPAETGTDGISRLRIPKRR